MNIQHGLNLDQTFSKTKNADLQELIEIFEGISQILNESGIDCVVHEWLCAQRNLERAKGRSITIKETQTLWATAQQLVRSLIVRHYFQFSYRNCAIRLADSHLFQTFCILSHCADPDNPGKTIVNSPSKSQLHRWENEIPVDFLNNLIHLITQQSSQLDPEKSNEPAFGLTDPISLEHLYLDTTCLEANIHYPVDWVLLRDAVRTLMKATHLIRKTGLINRMEPPKEFMKKMNQLAIKMANASHAKDAKDKKKKIFREMKKLLRTVEQHARKHRNLLFQNWSTTDLSEAEATNIMFRMDNVLNQIPNIISQAHERIINGQAVEPSYKLLSIYDPDLYVVVRKKAGKHVEFGNKLLLCEQEDGLIVDWFLYRDGVPSDNGDMLAAIVDRLKKNYSDLKKPTITTDRGFDCQRNRDLLEKEEIANYMCPRNVDTLRERMTESEFVEHQRRRSQTEARIGIMKNVFLKPAVRAKEFENRNKAVHWGILTHNLWVIARLARKQQLSALKKAA